MWMPEAQARGEEVGARTSISGSPKRERGFLLTLARASGFQNAGKRGALALSHNAALTLRAAKRVSDDEGKCPEIISG